MKKKAAQPVKRIRRRLCEPGNVIAIPLNDDLYAFARILNGDAGHLQVFDCVGNLEQGMNLVKSSRTRFYGTCILKPINKREWPVIGQLDFQDEAEGWSPPVRLDDLITPTNNQLMYRGIIRKATAEEVEELDVYRLWFPEWFTSLIKLRFGLIHASDLPPWFRKD